MKIMYVGHAAEVYVPALNTIVPHGVPVDVDDELGASLTEQDTWAVCQLQANPGDGSSDAA